jgi:hypothetical protein
MKKEKDKKIASPGTRRMTKEEWDVFEKAICMNFGLGKVRDREYDFSGITDF